MMNNYNLIILFDLIINILEEKESLGIVSEKTMEQMKKHALIN
jgi:hypothetical protein